MRRTQRPRSNEHEPGNWRIPTRSQPASSDRRSREPTGRGPLGSALRTPSCPRSGSATTLVQPEKARKRVLQWAKDNAEKAAQLNARNDRRRKAVERGASVAERFDAIEMFERDGWTCALCGQLIDTTLVFPDRMSATIDHVLPVSEGGQHTRKNVQAAHFTCNASKRDRLGISSDLPLG